MASLCGLVSPAGWDEDGQVMAVTLTTEDDREYFVDPVGKGINLISFVDSWVEVDATVHRDDGEYTLTVHGFSIISDELAAEY